MPSMTAIGGKLSDGLHGGGAGQDETLANGLTSPAGEEKG
jgi:hypothetical protein